MLNHCIYTRFDSPVAFHDWNKASSPFCCCIQCMLQAVKVAPKSSKFETELGAVVETHES